MVPELEKIATKMVGDGKGPNLYFVSLKGKIVAIHTSFKASYKHWKELALANSESESALEDRRYGVICSVSPDEDLGGMLIYWDESISFKRFYPKLYNS